MVQKITRLDSIHHDSVQLWFNIDSVNIQYLCAAGGTEWKTGGAPISEVLQIQSYLQEQCRLWCRFRPVEWWRPMGSMMVQEKWSTYAVRVECALHRLFLCISELLPCWTEGSWKSAGKQIDVLGILKFGRVVLWAVEFYDWWSLLIL